MYASNFKLKEEFYSGFLLVVRPLQFLGGQRKNITALAVDE